MHGKNPLLTTVNAGPYTLRGISLGGVYTTIQIPELGVLLDAGMPIRQFASANHIFLSHGHGDHLGALPALLGIRGLLHEKRPPNVYLPAEIVDTLQDALSSMSKLQRHSLAIHTIAMKPGDEAFLRSDLRVRAFRTHHPVPSLGYLFFDRVQKLKAEYRHLDGPEIGRRRKRGDNIFDTQERLELAYATDTLIRVFDTAPDILRARVLILECTFLDERKTLQASRAGCHIHLDELIERASDFQGETVVLMHFSQLYHPKEVHAILQKRCPPAFFEKIVIFAPQNGSWPG